MMLANILQSLSGTLNNIFLGHMIGVKALAAASAFFPVFLFLISFVMGLGSGASVLIGQAWGAKQPDRVRAVAGTTLSVGLIGGLVVALFGGGFAHVLLSHLDTPPDIMAEATDYARICLYAMPGFFAFLLMTTILRGVGDTITPLRALIVSTIVGLIVTPAFIAGWFGLPRLGVNSAAVGFVTSFLVTFAWLVFYLRWKGHALAPNAELMQAHAHRRRDPEDRAAHRPAHRHADGDHVAGRGGAAAAWSITSAPTPRRPTAWATRCWATCSSRPCRSPSPPPSWARRPLARAIPSGWARSRAPAS